MTTAVDEARLLRHRLRELEASVERAEARDAPAGGAAVVLRTKTVGTYPTTAAAFYACDVLTAGGTEAEGSAAALTAVASATVFALNVGTKKPPSGTEVVAVGADGRFLFQYDGSET